MPWAAETTKPFAMEPFRKPSLIRWLTYQYWHRRLFPADYCDACEQRTKQSLVGTHARICTSCGTIDAPKEIRPDGLFEVSEATLFPLQDTLGIFKALMMICVKDRVSRFILEPTSEDYRMTMLRDGVVHEMEPPPPELHRQIVSLAHCLWEAADNDASDSAYPLQIEVLGESNAQTEATFETDEAGITLTVSFEYWE